MMKRGSQTTQQEIEVLRPLEREPGGGRPNEYEHDHWEEGSYIALEPTQMYIASQQGTTVTGRFIFEQRPNVTAEHRFRIGTRVFEFRGGPMRPFETAQKSQWVVMVEEIGILTQSMRVEP